MNNKTTQFWKDETIKQAKALALRELGYKMGYDAGKNGANEENCNFRLFSSPEKTKEWERGNKKGLEDKESLLSEEK